MQFHVVTDAQDQMTPAILALLHTQVMYGQETVKLVSVDNPKETHRLFLDNMPGIKDTQMQLNELCPPPLQADLPQYKVEQTCICDAGSSVQDINRCMRNLKELVLAGDKQHRRKPVADRHPVVMGLDCEWPPDQSSSKVTLIQLSYQLSPATPIEVVLIRTHKLDNIPLGLMDLLMEKNITFTGRKVREDICKIQSSFRGTKNLRGSDGSVRVNVVDLVDVAFERDVVQQRTGGSLQKLVKVCLGQYLSKELQTSDWSQHQLSDEQKQYAANDAAASLEVYLHLHSLPNMAARLDADQAVDGVVADIVPMHSNCLTVSDQRDVVQQRTCKT